MLVLTRCFMVAVARLLLSDSASFISAIPICDLLFCTPAAHRHHHRPCRDSHYAMAPRALLMPALAPLLFAVFARRYGCPRRSVIAPLLMLLLICHAICFDADAAIGAMPFCRCQPASREDKPARRAFMPYCRCAMRGAARAAASRRRLCEYAARNAAPRRPIRHETDLPHADIILLRGQPLLFCL